MSKAAALVLPLALLAAGCAETGSTGSTGATGAAGTSDLIVNGVNFGTDRGEWARDGECDDPRFAGPGMTTTPLLSEDIKADATDCAAAWRAGRLKQR